MDVVAFLALLSALLLLHEAAHFGGARAMGIAVESFQVGLGPKVLARRWGNTEFVLAAIPFGAFLRFADPPHEHDRNPIYFVNQAFWRRTVVWLVGPAANFLVPATVYVVAYASETEVAPAIVGDLLPGSPAEGRLVAGDSILSVAGTPVRSFGEVTEALQQTEPGMVELIVRRGTEELEVLVEPAWDRTEGRLERRLGIVSHAPLPVVGIMSPAVPAAVSGLRTFDRVIAAAGRPVETFAELAAVIAPNRGGTIPLSYLRPRRLAGGRLDALAVFTYYEPRVTTVTPEPGPGSGMERSGIESSELYVSNIEGGALEVGDRILEVDGVAPDRFEQVSTSLRRPGAHRVSIRRGEQVIDRTLTGPTAIANWRPARAPVPILNPDRPRFVARNFIEAMRRLWGATVDTIAGRRPDMPAPTSVGGERVFLIALASFALGAINLLPIPGLDGGSIAIGLFELLRRRRLPARVTTALTFIGVLVVAGLAVRALTTPTHLEERRMSP